jgi:cell division protease FtsH
MRKLPLADDVEPMVIARGTPASPVPTWPTSATRPPCSPRRPQREGSRMEFDRAKDKIMMGAERRSMAM